MPRSEQECERVRLESKGKIVSAAVEVFAKKGYAAASTADIAKAANISVGLMYRYFSSKKELFDCISDFAVQGLIAVTERLSADGNPKEIILEICSELLIELDNDEFINTSMLMMQGVLSVDNQVKKEILSHDQKMFKAAADLIRRGQEEGLFKSGDPAAKSALLFSSIQGMAIMRFLLKESFKVPSLTDFTAFL